MQAIFRDGGRQYRVKEGDRLDLDLRDADPGSTIEFPDVLLVEDGETSKVGTPLVGGAKVLAKVLGEVKGPKLTIMTYRRRKDSRRKIGHRQRYLQVEIESIHV